MDENLGKIGGYDAVVRHFGRWPSFHDAVLEQFNLQLPGETLLVLRTWNVSDEIDEHGYFRTKDRAAVIVALTDVFELDLNGTDLQAGCILFGLELEPEDSGYQISLDPVLGVGGQIRCKGIRLEVEPEEAAPA